MSDQKEGTFSKLMDVAGEKKAAQSPAPKPKTGKKAVRKTNKRTKERTNKRTKIRHTFDIYEDQLFKLQEMKIRLRQRRKKKIRIGDLVQQALDQFLKKNERTK